MLTAQRDERVCEEDRRGVAREPRPEITFGRWAARDRAAHDRFPRILRAVPRPGGEAKGKVIGSARPTLG
jgi:hypothetical protein